MNTVPIELRLPCILFLAAILSSCVTAKKIPPAWIEVDSVLANPSLYVGKTITLKGWASIRTEDKGIWFTPEDYENRNRRHCISLLNTYKDEGINRSLDRKYVLVTGKIDPDSYHNAEGQGIVRLGSCNKVAIRFEEPNGLRLLAE
jgi:hypothetical protein